MCYRHDRQGDAADAARQQGEVYVLVDELTPGRLLTSLKSELASTYAGTTVFGHHYSIEELIARLLEQTRMRVEAHTGKPVDGAVLGRPVHFAGAADEAADARAEERLRQAARLAGLRDIAFELEPIAAARYFELSLAAPQNVLVFDFGGGTLDITVMRLGGAGERRVLACGGLAVGGDTFDQRIVVAVMLDHFGRGSTWGADASPFPDRYTDALVHWQSVPELNRPETLNFLQLAQLTGSHPTRVRAFQSLLVNNYAARMLHEVERAKVALSGSPFALIRLSGEDLDIWQPLTRSQFELLIAEVAGQVEACIADTLSRSGLRPDQIATVVHTGGSAQVPCFVELLGRLFGPQKVVQSDAFSSVSAGLAIEAWHAGGC